MVSHGSSSADESSLKEKAAALAQAAMIMGGFEPATQPRFTLGHTYATTTITRWANKHGIDLTDYLHRHYWGDLEDEDLQANETALETEARILSCYWLGSRKIYVITEADRSMTTLLFASEY